MHACQKCGTDTRKQERYCKVCKNKVLSDMAQSGYLTPKAIVAYDPTPEEDHIVIGDPRLNPQDDLSNAQWDNVVSAAEDGINELAMEQV